MEDKLKIRFKKLVAQINSYTYNIDIDKVKSAFEFAKVAHADEKRLSGEPMINHPLETAIILARWNMDEATLIAGLLHDTVDHGAATEQDIQTNFGIEVSELVKGVTKVSKLKVVGSSSEVFVENLRKMFLAIAKDLRIVFLRLAERIDNLKTLDILPEERRKNYAIDSLEIYGPLAERLGMWEAKSEIDDLAFKYAYPDEYFQLLKSATSYYKNVKLRIQEMRRKLLTAFQKDSLNAEVVARTKGYYSLWRKLSRSEISGDLESIHDIVALRILVEQKNDCYKALGILHQFYKPVAGLAISDFIAVPKPNGYQSIHTKVFGPDRKIAEVQIRTFLMHEEAEHGVSAHWQMSELKSKGKLSSEDIDKGRFSVSDDKLRWVKELANWQKEIKNPEEFLKAVKFDALSRRIFVFSPKGDVFDLPEGATPVDFAFAVHTNLGGYVKNAMVDGKIVPLSFVLQNGQVVEIVKSKLPREPNNDWLDFVKTTSARHEIKKQLRNQE